MNEREIAEQKLQQARKDKILSVQTADKEIKSLEAQLKALGKLELENWDYGYDEIDGMSCDPRIFMGGHSYGCNGGVCDTSPLHFIKGNALADLKRNQEDLEEFEVDGGYIGHGFGAKVANNGVKFRLPSDNMQWLFTLSETTEIHQKLGRVIAFARRKEAKNEN